MIKYVITLLLAFSPLLIQLGINAVEWIIERMK